MKKTILITLLALLGMTQAVAQEYEYVPFVREGVKWVYYYINEDSYSSDPIFSKGIVYLNLELKGDTVINGKRYKAMHKYHGNAINSENDTIPIYLREENKVVYGIVPDGKTYPDCFAGYGLSMTGIDESISSGKEFILYDFQATENYYESIFSYEAQYPGLYHAFEYLYCDTLMLGEEQCKRHVFNDGTFFIEGIGYDGYRPGYTLSYRYPVPMDAPRFNLSHVMESGDTIYKSVMFDHWLDYDETDSYLNLDREGVKWVNERIIVTNGDTIRCYYNYEFKGSSDKGTDCYYTGIDLVQGKDSIIATLDDIQFSIFSNNLALESVCEQGRNMIDFRESTKYGVYLYLFPECWDKVTNLRAYYIYRQNNQLLNKDNLVLVAPVTIEGVQCQRWAYIGEDGEVLAYVVEGIGFDSYEMGDLLTPFTRKPDPNADYQEWCGLSHVVKDGKIIYKGMRWRDGVMTGIDEVVADRSPRRPQDENYYNLMGQPVGKDVPTAPGIYIHQGKKIIVR